MFAILNMWTTCGQSKPSSPERRVELLAALARVEAELPVSTVANIAGVGRTRASGIITELWALGVVERREIGRTVLVSLARHSAAGELIDRLAHLDSEVIARLRSLPPKIEPAPATLLIFGSFARGEAERTATWTYWLFARRQPTLRNGRPHCPASPNRRKPWLGITSSCSTTASRSYVARRGRKPRKDATSATRFAAMPSCSSARNSTT